MKNIVIFGGPGSGKGTQSKLIAEKYGLYHISTGEILRQHIHRGSEIGKVADSYISKGHLIPDDLMIEILADLLDNNPEATARGVIFDGFPRTLNQARELDSMLADRGTALSVVLGLDVSDAVLTARLLQRGIDSGRADDNLETIQKRLEVYHHQTKPLKEYYSAEGLYRRIDGENDIDGVFREICDLIDSL